MQAATATTPAFDSPPGFGSYAPPAAPAEAPFLPTTTRKFAVMCLFTLGLYEIYWSYKNWQRIRARTGESLSPFWRAFWSPLWSFALFPRIHAAAKEQRVGADWSPNSLAALYLVLAVSWRLPGALWLISLLSFVAFLPVVKTVLAMNAASTHPEPENGTFSAGNMAGVIIGGVILMLAVVGTLFPQNAGS